MTICKDVTIFEGPDGSGKSSLAMVYAAVTGAVYCHMGPFPDLDNSLSRMYIEAMMPALRGYQPVVMDRSWLSEPIYGAVFRNGRNRIGTVNRRMIERAAMRCSPIVVNCRPAVEDCLKTFRSRRGMEMLKSEEQLIKVYDLYDPAKVETSLNMYVHDYMSSTFATLSSDLATRGLRAPPHHANTESGGNLKARVTLVSELSGDPVERDPLFRWPYGSFGSVRCSQWLCRQLEEAGIGEDQLCWRTIGEPASDLSTIGSIKMGKSTVIALGTVASNRLTKAKIQHLKVVSPYKWLAEHPQNVYPLITMIKEVLC